MRETPKALASFNAYCMELTQVADEIKSPRLQKLVEEWQQSHSEDEVNHHV